MEERQRGAPLRNGIVRNELVNLGLELPSHLIGLPLGAAAGSAAESTVMFKGFVFSHNSFKQNDSARPKESHLQLLPLDVPITITEAVIWYFAAMFRTVVAIRLRSSSGSITSA